MGKPAACCLIILGVMAIQAETPWAETFSAAELRDSPVVTRRALVAGSISDFAIAAQRRGEQRADMTERIARFSALDEACGWKGSH